MSTVLQSNTFWNSPDGINPYPVLQSLLTKCDFCDNAEDEEIVEKVDGYFLCPCCKVIFESQFTLTI